MTIFVVFHRILVKLKGCALGAPVRELEMQMRVKRLERGLI